MKKLSPYVFPAVVVLLVIFLISRWYDKRGQISDYGEGIEIENLSEEELSDALTGVGDYTTVPLEETSPVQGETPTAASSLQGFLRYEIKDSKVKLSVTVSSFDPAANYYVWLRPTNSDEPKQAFILVEGKGGLIGSGAFSVDQLPVEILVTKGSGLGENRANVVLRGMVEQDTSQ